MRSLTEYITKMKSNTYLVAATKSKLRGESRWKDFHDAYIKRYEQEMLDKIGTFAPIYKSDAEYWKSVRPIVLKLRRKCKETKGEFVYSNYVSMSKNLSTDDFGGLGKGSMIHFSNRSRSHDVSYPFIEFIFTFPETVWDNTYGNKDDHKVLFSTIYLTSDDVCDLDFHDYSGSRPYLYLKGENEKVLKQIQGDVKTICKMFNPEIKFKF